MKDLKVNWMLCMIMSFFFGCLGIDRFMMGKVGTGFLKLITFGGLFVWALVDFILIVTKHKFEGVKWI